jgi:hypothetical protein
MLQNIKLKMIATIGLQSIRKAIVFKKIFLILSIAVYK